MTSAFNPCSVGAAMNLVPCSRLPQWHLADWWIRTYDLPTHPYLPGYHQPQNNINEITCLDNWWVPVLTSRGNSFPFYHVLSLCSSLLSRQWGFFPSSKLNLEAENRLCSVWWQTPGYSLGQLLSRTKLGIACKFSPGVRGQEIGVISWTVKED